jgi:hypothetical protein
MLEPRFNFCKPEWQHGKSGSLLVVLAVGRA